MFWYYERRSGDLAVLNNENGHTIRIPVAACGCTVPGTWGTLSGGCFFPDKALTERKRKYAADLLRKLTGGIE